MSDANDLFWGGLLEAGSALLDLGSKRAQKGKRKGSKGGQGAKEGCTPCEAKAYVDGLRKSVGQ